MKKILFSLLCFSCTHANATGMAGSDPVIFKGMLNHLEYVKDNDNESSVHWDAEAWLGKDLNKLWFKSEGERHDGETREHRVQLLYNRAVLVYWDLQFGVAHDIKPSPSENWLAIDIHGTAPYFIDSDIELLVGEDGHSSLTLNFAQEWMFTQRLVLEPEIDIIAIGKDAEQFGVGKGLSQINLNLRLHYEIRREFSPYIGISSNRFFGNTKTFRNDSGNSNVMLGISAWF